MFEEKTDRHSQTLVVEGCKVTLHYNEQQNPDAIHEIKSILVAAPKAANIGENLQKS